MWQTPRVDSLKLAKLCTRSENAHKSAVRKKAFVFDYVAATCTTTGGTEEIRARANRYDQSA